MIDIKGAIGNFGYFIIEKTDDILVLLGMDYQNTSILRTVILLLGVIGLSVLLWWVTRKILIRIIHFIVAKSANPWDDLLIKKRFFSAIAHLIPLLFLEGFMNVVFKDFKIIRDFVIKSVDVLIVFVVLIALLRLLSTFEQVVANRKRFKDKPIHSFFQLGKIIIIGFMIIQGLSVVTDKDLSFFLTSLGAMTAIILLIFKDTILGFVGSIQLATNDMIRIGDWVTMEKFGADGDVIEINLATVKIQNFDKTISTIPTYSFISDSFKNWRGMEQSDGRRIKRSVNIEINSVRFCTPELLEKLQKIEYLTKYISDKEKEIGEYNLNNKISKEFLLNGKNQTNIGLFRRYVEEYLKHNPNVNSDMTLMVRQLSPTEFGVPIEIYCFSVSKEWEIYENVIADIFDHLFAATSSFGLSVFERPSGKDFDSKLVD